MLLRDNLDSILMEYDMNITDKGKDILKTGNPAIDKNYFLTKFDTLYDLF